MKKIRIFLTSVLCLSLLSPGFSVFADEVKADVTASETTVDEKETSEHTEEADQDYDMELRLEDKCHFDEDGNEYIELIILYSSQKTNGIFRPLTYNDKIAWTKLRFFNRWEKVKIINGEEVTPESNWYPIVQHYIELGPLKPPSGAYITLGDLNFDDEIDLLDLSELSLALIGEKTLTANQLKAADINESDKVDLSDLARLKQFVSHKDITLGS